MDTLEEVQNQIKVLNNEIKETLVDIREYLLTYAQNPFTSDGGHPSASPPANRGVAPTPSDAPPAALEVKSRQEAPPMAPQGTAGGAPYTAPVYPSAQGQPAPVGQWPVQVPYAAPVYPSAQGQPAPAGPWPVQVPSVIPGETGRQEPFSAPTPRSEGAASTPRAASPERDRAAERRAEDSEEAKEEAQPRSAQKRPEPPAAPGKNGARKGLPGPMARRSDKGKPDMESAYPSDEKETSPVEPSHVSDEEEPASVAQGQASVDMVTVAMLAPWVEDGIQRVGRNRLKGVVKTYAATGNLSAEHKDLIFQLINLDGNEATPPVVSLKDSLAVLADLDNLMVRSRLDKTGTAMLSVYLRGRSGAGNPCG